MADCNFCFSISRHYIQYTQQNNEQKSAQLAEKRLLEIGLPDALIEKCKQMILATKDHQKNADDDINYFNDADMAILGSNSGSYQLYIKNIRKEFSYYPDVIYRPGRLKVLQYFF